jgi:hypothetical protein
VGLGYIGSLSCLLVLSPLVLRDELAGRVFLPMSLIYLACALPAMYLAPDFTARSPAKLDVRAEYWRLPEQAARRRTSVRLETRPGDGPTSAGLAASVETQSRAP